MRVAQRLLGQRRWRLAVLALAALAAGWWPRSSVAAGLRRRALVSFRASQTLAEQARRGQAMAAALAVFERRPRAPTASRMCRPKRC